MYTLVIVTKFPGEGGVVRRFAAKRKSDVMAELTNYGDCLAWRLHDGSGWCDGTENAWRWVVDYRGTGVIL